MGLKSRMGIRSGWSRVLRGDVMEAVSKLDRSIDYRDTMYKLKRYEWTLKRDGLRFGFLSLLASLSLYVMEATLLFKLFIIGAYSIALLIPVTSQFILPFTPILSWLLLFFSSQFIPVDYRPHIWVSVLPTLESILYGANISDILTRYTSSLLDVMAWIPYGVVHVIAPFSVGLALWIEGEQGSLEFFGEAFGWLNIAGVLIQIIVPCAPPWYELRNGLTPASYSMSGYPGGLARIDALFHSKGYTNTFTSSPIVFGAFPSLHAGTSTLEALFLSHFFPRGRVFFWGYVFWLYWSTMYLTHHYLVDLVAGGGLAVTAFYYFLPPNLRHLSTSHYESQSEDEIDLVTNSAGNNSSYDV